MAPYLEQANLFNALNFDFPLAYKPTGGGSAFWPFYPANTTAMATTGRRLPLPERRRPGAAGRLGADELRLLLRRRLGRRRRRPAPTARSSSARRISMADLDRRLEQHRGGLGELLGIAGPVHPDHADARPQRPAAPWPASRPAR